MRACRVCYYFRPNDLGTGEGECMNRPPVVLAVAVTNQAGETMGTEFHNVRPCVSKNDWCAFFKHRLQGREDDIEQERRAPRDRHHVPPPEQE